jgi:hypothetical protein
MAARRNTRKPTMKATSQMAHGMKKMLGSWPVAR